MSTPSQEEKVRYAYRFPPCPAYDVEGMESYLQQMAQQGLILSKDGFFAGFAVFERRAPVSMRYRLQAAGRPKGFFDDNRPDAEQVEIAKESGWDYIATHGDFHIFATAQPDAVELDTDPAVQALALDAVRRRQRGNYFSILVLLVLYPIYWAYGNVFLNLAEDGLFFTLLGVGLVVWAIWDTIAQTRHLRALIRHLRDGQGIDHNKDWRKKSRRFRGGFVVFLSLVVLWVGLSLHNWSYDLTEAGVIPLSDYDGPRPFATLSDIFVPYEGRYVAGDFPLSDQVEVRSSALVPLVLDYREHGHLAGGQALSGGLNVRYYRTSAAWIAREIGREWANKSRQPFEEPDPPLDLPPLDVDFAYGSRSMFFENVVLVRGKTVLYATFYTSGEETVPTEQWVSVLAASME